jgi:hypothetical protein
MVKILYLLAGIALKQTVDEVKAVMNVYVQYLEKYRENVQTYKSNPAIQAGSVEAHRVIAMHKHQMSAAPEVKRLSRKILIVRAVPLAAYMALTIGLLTWIWWVEKGGK